jgi:hypothetical protein
VKKLTVIENENESQIVMECCGSFVDSGRYALVFIV